MDFIIETTVTISDKIKNLIQSGKYEDLVLTLLNQSKTLFKNEFIVRHLFSTKFTLRTSEIFLRNVKYACGV